MDSPYRLFTVIAGIATLVNLVLSLGAWSSLPTDGIGDMSAVTRIVVVFFLETALPYGFGFLYILVWEELAGAHGIVVAVFIATASAWVSYFNLVFILLNGTPLTEGEAVGLFFLGVLAWLWGAVIGGFHAAGTTTRVDQMMFNIGIVQVLPFILIYAGFIADSYDSLKAA